jgi:hypothetical protein
MIANFLEGDLPSTAERSRILANNHNDRGRQIIKDESTRQGAEYVDLGDKSCSKEDCNSLREGKPLFIDKGTARS